MKVKGLNTSVRFETDEQRKRFRIKLLSEGMTLQEWFQLQVKRELRETYGRKDG